MKNTISLFIILTSSFITAQVGVNTNDPQQMLHVAGSNETIRVDGLNSTNNVKNLGGVHTNNLNIDNNGDMTIDEAMVESLIDIKNTASSINIKTTANSSYVGQEIYSRSFTLTRRAQIFIDYVMSCNVLDIDASSEKTDGRSKAIYTFYHLGDGTTADTTNSFGATETSYTNISVDAATGLIHNSSSGVHILEAGTYSIHLIGGVFGGGLDNDASFSSTFSNEESLKVIALYF